MKDLSDKIVTMVENNGGYETIRSIGVSSPSASSVSGCIENAANLPWKGIVPLAALLRDRIGLAVGLSNDAHVSALGEYTFGCAHGMKNFIILSLGVGIGSCSMPLPVRFISLFLEDKALSKNNSATGKTAIHRHG